MQQLNKLYYIASATFLEGVRNKVLWAVVVLSISLTMANISIAKLFSWDLGKVSIEFGLSAVSLSGLLLVFFLGLKILSDDFERNRIHMLMARPISGWQYITGKFLGLASILLVMCLLLAIGAALSQQFFILQYPRFVPPNYSWTTYIMALCCQWMSLMVILAITILCYSFASNSFIALLLAVSSYIIGQNLGLLRKIIMENPYSGFLSGQDKLIVILSWIFPNLYLFDKKSVAAYGFPFSTQEFTLLFLYCISYTGILLYFSSLLIKRKDIG